MITRIMTAAALLLAGLSLVHQMRPAVWIEYQGDRVAVRARAPDGKKFGVLVFDRSLLASDGGFTGVDVTAAPPHLQNYVPLRWVP